MSLDQQVADTGISSPLMYDEKYVDLADNLLKEAAADFKREKKCV